MKLNYDNWAINSKNFDFHSDKSPLMILRYKWMYQNHAYSCVPVIYKSGAPKRNIQHCLYPSHSKKNVWKSIVRQHLRNILNLLGCMSHFVHSLLLLKQKNNSTFSCAPNEVLNVCFNRSTFFLLLNHERNELLRLVWWVHCLTLLILRWHY